MVSAAGAAVARFVDERAQDMQTKPAFRPVGRGLVELRRALRQRVERPAVIAEIDLDPAGLRGERHLDLGLRRPVRIAVMQGVGEQLFEDDQQPRSFRTGQPAATGELLGKFHQAGEFGLDPAQPQSRVHQFRR